MSESPLWLAIVALRRARRCKADPKIIARLEAREREEAAKVNAALRPGWQGRMEDMADKLGMMETVTLRLPKRLMEDVRGMVQIGGEEGVEPLMRQALQQFVDRWVRERQKQRRAAKKEK